MIKIVMQYFDKKKKKIVAQLATASLHRATLGELDPYQLGQLDPRTIDPYVYGTVR